MSCWAFIFARGGSKGLPGKNIKPLNGKPLIAYAIESAKSVSVIERVFVSTDDREIANVAEKYGAEIPFIRPSELATDNASEWLAWQHAVSEVQTMHGNFETFVSLPTTAPCRTVTDIEKTVNKLDSKTDIVVTVSESNHNPYFNVLKMDKDGLCHRFIDSPETVTRRQDVPQAFNMTTAVYVSRPDYILSAKSMWEGVMRAQIIEPLNAIDIDDESDFKLAELVIQDRANT